MRASQNGVPFVFNGSLSQYHPQAFKNSGTSSPIKFYLFTQQTVLRRHVDPQTLQIVSEPQMRSDLW